MAACESSRRQPTEALRCPRCDSADTKFCYYNNYNTSQPRHFCKSCKRYWTAGGTLRNVPVGGGLRRNKKSKLLSQVKDIVPSSSGELLNGNSMAANSPNPSTLNGLVYEAHRAFSFAPPLHVASTSSSTEMARDVNFPNNCPYKNINQMGYGYLTDNRFEDYAVASVDASLLNSMNFRRQAHFQGHYSPALSEDVHPHLSMSAYGLHNLPAPDAAADQDQSCNGGISELPCETSQATLKSVCSSQALDLYSGKTEKMHACGEDQKKLDREESADASVVSGQLSASEFDKPLKEENATTLDELRHSEDSQLRDISSTDIEDEELGNVINVRYPYDWDQVSEVLFGGTSDYFQLSGY
ncbi:hypothetical protein KP509_09G055200 [Ceratopteris richardii]|uniref:Dof-type domain-containing protein n=1 Tax=Ceratopteris richardii TaxID=49495 RepID=A0A8T2U2P1_CERRI|nr:hypothetical protein KP509_09G055200 [Ceratopteris richardii]